MQGNYQGHSTCLSGAVHMHCDVSPYFSLTCAKYLVLLDAELKHRLNAAAASAMHNRMLIVAYCRGQNAVVYSIIMIIIITKIARVHPVMSCYVGYVAR